MDDCGQASSKENDVYYPEYLHSARVKYARVCSSYELEYEEWGVSRKVMDGEVKGEHLDTLTWREISKKHLVDERIYWRVSRITSSLSHLRSRSRHQMKMYKMLTTVFAQIKRLRTSYSLLLPVSLRLILWIQT